MSSNSKVVHEVGLGGAINADAGSRNGIEDTKRKGILAKLKHSIGKVITIEENWILKSRDWPYLWTKK